MDSAFVSIFIQAIDTELSVKLLVPIDVLYLFDKITWIWHHGEYDAFPEGFLFNIHDRHQNSLRIQGHLFDGLEEIEKNTIYDFRKCNRISTENYINSLENLKIISLA